MPQVLCHRDYHVRNLMLFQDKLYVIDFQDARWGPTTYDLASLLKDCFSECFQLDWTQKPGFRPDDEGIQNAVKHFPDLSSDPQTFKRTKLSALKPLVSEKMFEGA